MQHLTLARRDTAWSCFMSLHFMVADIINQRDSWRWLKPWWHAASLRYEDWWIQHMRHLGEHVNHMLTMTQNLSWASSSLRAQLLGCVPDDSTQRMSTMTDSELMARFAMQHDVRSPHRSLDGEPCAAHLP